MNALMEMKNINKSFGSNRVLENVNVSLYSGEVLALLGENGAGKSTLIKILGGIYKKDSGQIYVKDQLAEINKCLLIKQLSVTSNSYICSGHARIGTDAKEHKVFASES